jgi:hypothetical protein
MAPDNPHPPRKVPHFAHAGKHDGVRLCAAGLPILPSPVDMRIEATEADPSLSPRRHVRHGVARDLPEDGFATTITRKDAPVTRARNASPSMPRKSFYIIDGHAHIFRAYFAPFRDLTSPTGEPTKATFVFTQMLLNLIAQRKPDGRFPSAGTADSSDRPRRGRADFRQAGIRGG